MPSATRSTSPNSISPMAASSAFNMAGAARRRSKDFCTTCSRPRAISSTPCLHPVRTSITTITCMWIGCGARADAASASRQQSPARSPRRAPAAVLRHSATVIVPIPRSLARSQAGRGGVKPPKTTSAGRAPWPERIEQSSINAAVDRFALTPARLHLAEHRRSRPAIDFKPVAFLIFAERGARQHASLAVDLVVVVTARGEKPLHPIEIDGRQLHEARPRRFERPRLADAIAQMPDKQDVEIGEIVFLDGKIILGGKK